MRMAAIVPADCCFGERGVTIGVPKTGCGEVGTATIEAAGAGVGCGDGGTKTGLGCGGVGRGAL